MKCGYCGQRNHPTDYCPTSMLRTGRWTEKERDTLKVLQGLAVGAMRYDTPIAECPEAVRLYATLGIKKWRLEL